MKVNVLVEVSERLFCIAFGGELEVGAFGKVSQKGRREGVLLEMHLWNRHRHRLLPIHLGHLKHVDEIPNRYASIVLYLYRLLQGIVERRH